MRNQKRKAQPFTNLVLADVVYGQTVFKFPRSKASNLRFNELGKLKIDLVDDDEFKTYDGRVPLFLKLMSNYRPNPVLFHCELETMRLAAVLYKSHLSGCMLGLDLTFMWRRGWKKIEFQKMKGFSNNGVTDYLKQTQTQN